jgi:flagellar biogenesis protein FliO
LKALAPTQSERPFVVTQLVVLAAFVLLIILAVRKFSHGLQSGQQRA